MRVAILGTGSVALRHLGVLAQLPDVSIVAHLSSSAARAEAQSAEWGGRPYTNLEHLLDREHPEAVWLCLIPDQHGPPEMALIQRRIPFFVEKPLSVNLRPAEDIAARIGSLVTAVGYKFRALDTLARVRSLLSEIPPRMALGAWHDATPPPAWWSQPERSGGQMVEQATHLVDLARLLLGEADVLSATIGPQVSAAHVRFGDVPAVFTATSLLRGRQAIHLQLVCSGHVITITEQQVVIETGRETESFATTVDPFLEEDRLFLEAVQAGDPRGVLSSYEDALKTHRLCVAIRDRLSSPSP